MSLKAKLEAVIYAAEEPVTLAQMSVLFADEALEWKAEHASAAPEPTQEDLALLDLEALSVSAQPAAPKEQADPTAPATQAETSPEQTAPATPDPTPDPDQEAKRLTRLRDREVREVLRSLLEELVAEYASAPRGIEIREIAGGYRMATKPECHDAVRAFVKSLKPPMKLSMPALETLAVIAYKQPVTAPEVGEIRGVDSAGVLGSLISRKLITTAGRKQVVGRPMLYKTTKEFLLRFGLKDVSELPSMEEFEKMAAIELSEVDEEDSPANQSGDLFAAPETSAEAPATSDATDAPVEESKQESPSTEIAPIEVEQLENHAVPTPTAEPSPEAAAAHAPVERQDAEEIEVQ